MTLATPELRSPWRWLRMELAGTPERWREAFWVAMATITSIAASLALGAGSGTAPLLTLVSLAPTALCTWRNLPRRLALILAPAALVVPVGGFLLQLPALFVPALFATIATILYFLPLTKRPVEAVGALLVILDPLYLGVLDPSSLATATGAVAVDTTIAAVVATLFAELARPGGVRLRLAESLEASFREHQGRLAAALARSGRVSSGAEPAAAGAAPEVPTGPAIRLLDQLRQDGLDSAEERLLVLLTSTAERAGSFVGALEVIADECAGGKSALVVPPSLAAPLAALAAGIDEALDGFAEASVLVRGDGTRAPSLGSVSVSVSTSTSTWPDLHALRTEVEHARAGLRVGAADSIPTGRDLERVEAWIDSLSALAVVLATSPYELQRLVAEDPRRDPRALVALPASGPRLDALDPIAARYSLQVALATTICFHLGLATHQPAPVTFLWNPLLVTQSSYGATIRFAALRSMGMVIGAIVSLVVVIAFMPATDDLAAFLTLIFVLVLAGQYAALGSPRWSQVGYQAAVTVLLVTVANGPVVAVDAVLWRVWGVTFGIGVLFVVLRVVAPDTAGRQLVARLRDLAQILTGYLPGPGRPLAPLDELIRERVEVGRIGADLLRLIEETRIEGQSGIDPNAASEATGLAMRSAYRAGLVARSRSLAPLDGVADEPRALLAAADAAAAAYAERIRCLLEGAARRGGPERRRANVLTPEPPDLAAAVAAVSTGLATGRAAGGDAMTAGAGEVIGTVEHLRRLGVLLPRLETALMRMLGPGARVVCALALLCASCGVWRLPVDPLRAADPGALAPVRSDRAWEPTPELVSPGGTPGGTALSAARAEAGAAATADPTERDRGPLDLPGVIDLGLRESPSTRAAWESARVAAAQLGRSLEPYYPTLRAAARVSPNERILFQDSPDVLVVRQDSYEPQVALTYTLLDFGRRAHSATVARERLTAANFSFNRELQRVAFELAHAYFMLDAAIALEAAATENVELARRVHEAAARKLDVGLGTRPDVLLAEQVETRALYDRESARAAIRAAQAQLGRALGREANRVPAIQPLGSRPVPAELDGDVEALLARALEQRPDLAAHAAEARAAAAEVDRARADFLPTVGFHGTYGLDAWDYTFGDSKRIQTAQPAWATEFRFDWDVFRGFGRENAVREARAGSERAQANLDRERIDVSAEVWTAYYDFQAARQKLVYAESLLASAAETYDATSRSYANGLLDIVALLTAERDLASARATRVRARAELLTAAARLGFVVGLAVPVNPNN